MDSKHKELQDDNITRYGSGTENMEGSIDPEMKILPEQALENQWFYLKNSFNWESEGLTSKHLSILFLTFLCIMVVIF